MNLITFIRLLLKNIKWLVLFPVAVVLAVIFFTRNIEQEYASSTLVYTGLASGYDITSEAGKGLDFFSVNNAFDNMITTIKARETLEQVSVSLMAQHLMLDKPTRTILSGMGYTKRNELFPDTLRRRLVVPGNFPATVQNILLLKNSSADNHIVWMMNHPGSFYSIKQLTENLSVYRKQNSDMLEMTYKAIDPGVTQNTLIFLSQAFISKYKLLKSSETGNVAQYFEDQLRRSRESLASGEDQLKDFAVDNRIINYNEQSKFVAESRENLKDEINKEKMNLAANKSSLATLESKVDGTLQNLTNNKDILKTRQQISSLSTKLAFAEIYNSPPEITDSLRSQIKVLQQKMKNQAMTIYQYNYSVESVPITSLLNNWLEKVMGVEESTAKLKVFEERKVELDNEYDQYAPLGSTLNKLQRTVTVAEQEYLSALNGLNQANLRKQSLELSSQMSIVDAPYFPLSPEKSKRKLLVAVSLLASFFFVLSLITAMYLLDNSVKTPSRAKKFTRLSMLGALPLRSGRESSIDIDLLESSLIEQIASSVKLETNTSMPQFMFVISNREAEGKTNFALKLLEKNLSFGDNTLLLLPEASYQKIPASRRQNVLAYQPNKTYINTQSPQELLAGTPVNFELYKLVIIELPSLNNHPIPNNLVKFSDLSVLVINATRVWAEADDHLLELYRKTQSGPVMFLLNAVGADMLEGIYGEVPRKRSLLRKMAKKLVSFNFIKTQIKTLV